MKDALPKLPCEQCFKEGPDGYDDLAGGGKIYWLHCEHNAAGAYFPDDEVPIRWRMHWPIGLVEFRDLVHQAAIQRSFSKGLQVAAPGPGTATH